MSDEAPMTVAMQQALGALGVRMAPPPAPAPPPVEAPPPEAPAPSAPPPEPGLVAKAEIDRLKGDQAFVTRYLDGDAEAKAIMTRLHESAYGTAVGETQDGTSVDTSQQARQLQALADANTPRDGGVPVQDYNHLPADFHPPAQAMAYQLPLDTIDAHGAEGVQGFQALLHHAALPKGIGEAIAERALQLTPPADKASAELAERECDQFLVRTLGDDYEAAWGAFAKLMDRMPVQLYSAMESDGIASDPIVMTQLLRHALRLYGPRITEEP